MNFFFFNLELSRIKKYKFLWFGKDNLCAQPLDKQWVNGTWTQTDMPLYIQTVKLKPNSCPF